MAGLTIAEFQDGYSHVTVDGVKRIYTSTTAKQEFQSIQLPAIIPDPIRPLDYSLSERASGMDERGRAWWSRTRVLNYVCLVAQIGQGRTVASHAELASQLADAVENSFCDFGMDGLANLGPVRISDFGVLDDAVSSALPNAGSVKFLGFTVQVQTLTGYRKD